MPFKVVQTMERGRLRLTSVPDQWEKNGNLFWPKNKQEKLRRQENCNPDPTWTAINCIVKRRNLKTFKDAESEIDSMCDRSDTETDNERFRTKQLSPTIESFNQMAQESVEVLLILVATLCAAAAEETPSGHVNKESDKDQVAEASHNGNAAQKREATLSNSYGDPLPSDAYGPPQDLANTISDLQLPAPVYGVPQQQIFQETPPGAYGPPAPVVFPSQIYHGPPPPISKPKQFYGPPKIYGPPKPIYGPPKFSQPKPVYGPPKKTYGPPKQNLPKPIYGVPFKPPKFSLHKPLFSPSKPIYGSPKPIYGPPKINYGPPIVSPPPLPELPALSLPPVDNNIDLGLNLPAPIYGTPLVTLPSDLKPNFPIPSDSYGPPGQVIGGPIGPPDQILFQNVGSGGHYGPPQPDPNPRPPHPGIPAPPTPPHVLYDGWKPIPGVSLPINQNIGHDVHQEVQIHVDHSHQNGDQHFQFPSPQITTGYANVHQDALANIDLNAIVGGDSNGIDQSKTIFEAHYTDNRDHGQQEDISVVQGKPFDTYGAPPLDSFSSNGPYSASLRQQGAKGLVSPSGFYGVPLGSQYGAPPKHNNNLPLPYGYHSGGGHSGLNSPQKPIKFRESVPEGLIENIGQTVKQKDAHGIDNVHQGPTYIPPPIREVKDINGHTGNSGINSVSLSIEPTNLFSLPHSGNPISFQHQQQGPSNLYGSPIDSYAAPLLTVGIGDHVTSGTSDNAVTSTIDGTLLANLSNLDAAAILKHCPYHEAILKAAQTGERIPADLAAKYVNSLSALGTTLNKSSNTVATQDLVSSQSVIHPSNEIKNEKRENFSLQKGKSLDDKNISKDQRLESVSNQILKTSERIRDLNQEAKELQKKIAATSQNLYTGVPIPSKIGSYSVQIQGSNNQNTKDGIPHDQLLSEGLLQSVLQAIEGPKNLQQNRPQQTVQQHNTQQNLLQQQQQQILQQQQSLHQQQQIFYNDIRQQSLPQVNFQNFVASPPMGGFDGIDLPAGYEPVDRTKDQTVQASQQVKTETHDMHTHNGPCDLKTAGSLRTEVMVPPPEKLQSIDKDDNEVAIYFDEKEPVTEISVATSISEEESGTSGKAKA